MGPSASEAAANADCDKLEGFVKSLSNIQHVLKDPTMRSVVGALAPGLLTMFPSELGAGEPDPVRDAKDGLPSSSKPGVKGNGPATVAATGGPKVKASPASVASNGNASRAPVAGAPAAASAKATTSEAKTPPALSAPTSPAAPSADGPGEPDGVNSSTHRAAHARLSRRMEKLDPAAFPHMAKLWAGGRKDPNQCLGNFFVRSHYFPSKTSTCLFLHSVCFPLPQSILNSCSAGKARAFETIRAEWREPQVG